MVQGADLSIRGSACALQDLEEAFHGISSSLSGTDEALPGTASSIWSTARDNAGSVKAIGGSTLSFAGIFLSFSGTDRSASGAASALSCTYGAFTDSTVSGHKINALKRGNPVPTTAKSNPFLGFGNRVEVYLEEGKDGPIEL
ncbi:MAG TPA: hypothetical protein VNZ86_15515 [Bacteroidia bacterium]|jgi:hypothetical protein|nr:hypothetical protein [Bacteroidia bacterium]